MRDVLRGPASSAFRVRAARNAVGAAPVAVSERHREILRMIAEGLTDREIAKALFLSVTGAKACVRDIYWRYRLRNRAHAAAWAVREGLA